MGWLLSLLPNGIKMNVEAVGLNTSLNFSDYKSVLMVTESGLRDAVFCIPHNQQ